MLSGSREKQKTLEQTFKNRLELDIVAFNYNRKQAVHEHVISIAYLRTKNRWLKKTMIYNAALNEHLGTNLTTREDREGDLMLSKELLTQMNLRTGPRARARRRTDQAGAMAGGLEGSWGRLPGRVKKRTLCA